MHTSQSLQTTHKIWSVHSIHGSTENRAFSVHVCVRVWLYCY